MIALTLRGVVTSLAAELGDADWEAAAIADPVVYAPHTPYFSGLDDSDTRPRCCRFAVNAPIHLPPVVGPFYEVLPRLMGATA